MKKFKHVELFLEPSAVLDIFDKGEKVTQMSDTERGFLCGLIRDHRPKKLVEVGVAEGGTSAVILECIRQLDIECNMYSVDLSERLYYDEDKPTGYVLDIVTEHNGAEMQALRKEKHRFLLGQVLPERLDEIGDQIDFLILDTVHALPGEVLDFIAAFPYLASDAIVVLHDTALHYQTRSLSSIATSVLFQSVTADKFLNNQDRYPNIAAFQLNSDTPTYIGNMFSALLLPWKYIPEENQRCSYMAAIKRHYDGSCLQLYRQAIAEAKIFHGRLNCGGFKYILLYGKGKRGQVFLRYAQRTGIEISGFVVSDGQIPLGKRTDFLGIPVYEYSQIPFSREETLLIQTANLDVITQILQTSQWHWIDLPLTFWQELGV